MDLGRNGRARRVFAAAALCSACAFAVAVPRFAWAGRVPADRLQAIFEKGRASFFQEVGRRLPASPFRAQLSDEEAAKLSGGLPDLYERLMALAWEKDEPAYRALIDAGDAAAFESRFLALSTEYARRLVDNLFVKSSDYDLMMTLPAYKNARPFDLFLRTVGYGAKTDDPHVPPGKLNRPPDPNLGRQWWIPAIRLPEAHRVSTGQGVTVAVIDTGIDSSLGLFKDRVAQGGINLVARTGPPWHSGNADAVWDWGDHGTIVSSVLLTTAPGVKVMPIRDGDGNVMNDPPYPYWMYETAVAAIYHAVHHGAQVINFSAGLGNDIPILREAVLYAWNHNVPMCVSAGRWGRISKIGDPHPPDFPAEYAEVIQTGSFGVVKGLFQPWERLFGSDQMDLLTPGMDVYMEVPSFSESQNDAGTGTSLSAPVAAGVLALMMAARPMTPVEGKTPAAYSRLLERGLHETSNAALLGRRAFDPITGYGAVDAAAAVDWARKH